jgi:hypothetical protein
MPDGFLQSRVRTGQLIEQLFRFVVRGLGPFGEVAPRHLWLIVQVYPPLRL